MLYEVITEMVKYDIDHVTVTINTVDTTGEIGSQIYPWIFYNNKRYYGKEAAQILLERQLEGRITSYNVCYTKLLRPSRRCRPAPRSAVSCRGWRDRP